jgi:hypothetical protein
MQADIDHQENKYDRSVWILIGHDLLSEEAGEGQIGVEKIAGSHSQTWQELGMQPESLVKVEGIITRAIQEAKRHFLRSRSNLPVHILLFCQKMLLESVPRYENQMLGGWGYYILERSVDFPCPVCDSFHRVIELYLYKEGVNPI